MYRPCLELWSILVEEDEQQDLALSILTYLSCTVNEVTFFVLVMCISSKVDLALGRTCGSSPSTQVIHP